MIGAPDLVRRGVDVVAALVGLVLTAPIVAAAAVAIRRDLGPGVLYRQERLGRGGRPFGLLKFRTMRHPEPGREDPAFDAERLTPVGEWLRSTSVDELPSLVNLLKGDIGLVGPRPLPTHYWERYRGPEYERFLVRPGVTGLAQVSGRNAIDWDERLALDVEYVRTRTLLGDLRILFRTAGVVFGRAGISGEGAPTMQPLPAQRTVDVDSSVS